MQRYTRPSSGLGRGLGHLPPQGIKYDFISYHINIRSKIIILF